MYISISVLSSLSFTFIITETTHANEEVSTLSDSSTPDVAACQIFDCVHCLILHMLVVIPDLPMSRHCIHIPQYPNVSVIHVGSILLSQIPRRAHSSGSMFTPISITGSSSNGLRFIWFQQHLRKCIFLSCHSPSPYAL